MTRPFPERYPAVWSTAVLGAALLVVYAVTLAPGLTWAHEASDGGDLIAAAASGGVAHPTGYPLYLLLARFFLWLPVRSPAWRVTCLSAVSAAVAGAAIALVVSGWHRGRRPAGLAGGLLAGFAFGLSPLLWSQAVVAEVYSLNAALVALCWLAMPHGQGASSVGRAGLAGAVQGLALGNHVTSVFMLPVLLAAVWRGSPDGRWRRLAAAGGAAAITAGALYGLLPLWAAAGPAVNWGDAATPQGWWWLVSAEPYRGLAFAAGSVMWGRLAEALGVWVAQFGPAGLAAGLAALFWVRDLPGLLRGGLVWLFAISLIFATGYNTRDSYNYLTPAFLVFAVSLGLGLARLLDEVGSQAPAWGPAVVGLAALFVFFNAVPAMAAADASRDTRAEDFIRAVDASAPAGAIVVTGDDRDSFALWYLREALGRRRDLTVVVERLAAFDWYRLELAGLYPGLNLPPAQSDLTAGLRTLNARIVCRTHLDQTGAVTCAAH